VGTHLHRGREGHHEDIPPAFEKSREAAEVLGVNSLADRLRHPILIVPLPVILY